MTTKAPAAASDTTVRENLRALSRGDAPVLEQLAQMTLDTLPRSGLDEETYTLVRIAALVASDAPAVSYVVNLGSAAEIGVPVEDVQGTLVAIAPIVGSARLVAAAGNMLRALGFASDLDGEELDGEDDEDDEDEVDTET